VRYDQRGHGRSTSPPQGYRWGDHAADLAAVVASLDAAPAHLVGMSKGGGIAIELALRRPELVASLSLVGAMVPDFQLSDELMASFRELARGIRRDGVARAVEALWLTHPLVAFAAALPAARARLEAMLRAFPSGRFASRRWSCVGSGRSPTSSRCRRQSRSGCPVRGA
jgi:pimeloyl-ACP methyl ester carboxylesterase